MNRKQEELLEELRRWAESSSADEIRDAALAWGDEAAKVWAVRWPTWETPEALLRDGLAEAFEAGRRYELALQSRGLSE